MACSSVSRRPGRFGLLVLLVFALAPRGGLRAEPPACTCAGGNGTYDFLNAPVTPPDDEIHCPFGRATDGGCRRVIPEGWDRACYDNGKMECFLRRHAASWQIACSARLEEGTCACRTPHPDRCPACGKDGKPWGREGLAVVRKQVEIEKPLMGRRDFMVLTSPHFYLVTDIKSLKVRTRAGKVRLVKLHELAHLYIQRAEIARQDFIRHFGDRIKLTRPCAMFLMDDESTSKAIQSTYFGDPRSDLRYGAGSTDISGGLPTNGFSYSLQGAKDDRGLHLKVRHAIGHILMSCYITVATYPPELPAWVHASAGHWLARLPEKFREMAAFCSDEGRVVKNNGRKWGPKLRKYAGSSKSVPIQRVFDVNTLANLDLEMHIKGWSWFDLGLREDRERFVKFIGILRSGKDHRTAMKEAFSCTPEEFEKRWADRIHHRRPSIAPTVAELDAGDPSRPGAMERASIRAETDPATLAGRIRALSSVDDPLTAATILPLAGSTRSDSVRETIAIVLSQTKSPAVRTWLRTEGLSGHAGLSRAMAARAIGDSGDREAGAELMKFAADGFWLTRAHVARALGLIGHEPAVPVLAGMVKDKSPRVRIAAMDALGRLGERAGSAWEVVAGQLGAKHWQVRSAAAECLGNLGRKEAHDPMVSRMEIETGRIERDLQEALRVLGRKRAPKRVVTPGPTYYGLEVASEGVGYVLDSSSSMLTVIEIDKAWLERNRRDYGNRAAKYDLAISEVAASLGSLSPRARFNLYFFRTRALAWKAGLVPASPSNVKAAVASMAGQKPAPPSKARSTGGMTNYVDVFRHLMGVKAGQVIDGGLGDTPDTVFFLTDGTPTAGDITNTEVLVSWFTELNRFARVRVNVITFGNLDVNSGFLRRLAENNDGAFIQIPSGR